MILRNQQKSGENTDASLNIMAGRARGREKEGGGEASSPIPDLLLHRELRGTTSETVDETRLQAKLERWLLQPYAFEAISAGRRSQSTIALILTFVIDTARPRMRK